MNAQEKAPWVLGRMVSGFGQSRWLTRDEAMAFFDRLRRAAYPRTIPGAVLFGPHREEWTCDGHASADWKLKRKAQSEEPAA